MVPPFHTYCKGLAGKLVHFQHQKLGDFWVGSRPGTALGNRANVTDIQLEGDHILISNTISIKQYHNLSILENIL